MLRTNNILLRAIEPEDLELLYTIENDSTLWDVGSVRTPYSRFALKRYIESQPSDIFTTGQLRLAIVIRATEETIGFVDLFDYSALSARAEIGIALLNTYRRKGYALQTLHLVEEYAFTVLHLRFLYAHVSATSNLVAYRLFTSADYQHVATLPQWHQCSQGIEDIIVFQKFNSMIVHKESIKARRS